MTIVIILLSALLLFYLSFLLKIYKGLNNLYSSKPNIPGEFISVIIPFRNEECTILSNLRSLESQDYPDDKFEINYVNDHSTDNSLNILIENKKRKNIKVLDLPSSSGEGKKRAVEYGILSSTGEIIVTTDTDCTHKPAWLRTLVSYFDQKTAMVAGSIELSEGNNLFQKVQRLEFAGLVTAGAGLIGAGDPYICNAANLAYRKNIFHQLGGFADNIHLSSGDDELLMQKIARETEYEIKFCPDKAALVSTLPNNTLRQFYNQRKRWSSKGLFYKDKFKIINLILIFIYYISLFLQFFLLFFFPPFLLTFLFSFIIKITFENLIMKKAAAILFDKRILRYFLLTELLQIPYIVIMPILGAMGSLNWKNRKLDR